MAENKELVLGISAEKGIVSVIEPDGEIGMYRHPLVDAMSSDEIASKIEKGEIVSNIMEYTQFPNNWEIETEEPEITGDFVNTIDTK